MTGNPMSDESAVEADPLYTGNDAADLKAAFAEIARTHDANARLQYFLGYINVRMSLHPWATRDKRHYTAWALSTVGYRLAADVKWEVSAHLKRAAEQVRRHAPGNLAVESAALAIETVADSILTDALRAKRPTGKDENNDR